MLVLGAQVLYNKYEGDSFDWGMVKNLPSMIQSISPTKFVQTTFVPDHEFGKGKRTRDRYQIIRYRHLVENFGEASLKGNVNSAV